MTTMAASSSVPKVFQATSSQPGAAPARAKRCDRERADAGRDVEVDARVRHLRRHHAFGGGLMHHQLERQTKAVKADQQAQRQLATHRGYFAQADGGTLVLDEIAELSPRLQPKLLRALQFGEIQPVGGSVGQVDVRIVACTHRDLQAEVKAGRFRQDLLYRLAVVELVMPSLRGAP